ncbi:15636_t:CDS:2 [Racocetra fulgida]|uniref:15636_t:CDS:1 n=1 Tax=Racocetra fulgida TaxID=60492 RepID=A0A9N9BES6_9GLOM|nr:15636_t:CDS:2 [Racocetra fulgida]
MTLIIRSDNDYQAQGLTTTVGPQITQNNSISISIAAQRYNYLVEGGNPFSGLQDSEIPLQNVEFSTAIISGTSFS